MTPNVSLPPLQRVVRQSRLTRCYYLAGFCTMHGEARFAIEKLPRSRRRCACPACSEKSVFAILDVGGTTAPLPHFSIAPTLNGRTMGRGTA
jgi:hypothetical protein